MRARPPRVPSLQEASSNDRHTAVVIAEVRRIAFVFKGSAQP
jgi:hypothetical protein